MKTNFWVIMAGLAILLLGSVCACADEATAASLRQVEQYNFSIHILAMLLVGFGFLMVFVKNYGYSATTGTYLVVAVGLPLYLLLRSMGVAYRSRFNQGIAAGGVCGGGGVDFNGGSAWAAARISIRHFSRAYSSGLYAK